MQSQIYCYVGFKYACYAVSVAKQNLGEDESPLLQWGPEFMSQPLKTAESSLLRYQKGGKTHQPAVMEDQVSTNAYENFDTTNIYEIPDFDEDKGDHLYDPVHEDPASPSSITTIPESMENSQESSEDSCSNSVASQHGADGEDGSSSHHGAEEDHPYQEMDLISPTLEDKHAEGMMFESNVHFPPDFQLRRRQSTSSNSSTSLKFPLNNNFGETDNFQEDCEICIFVKKEKMCVVWRCLEFLHFKWKYSDCCCKSFIL
ncbi:uncharacterized protein FYN12_001885 isoform 2-T7 [Phoenicopterus ruber ruber]